MKLIKLSQGKFAQVDDEDYDFLNQWKWSAKKAANTFYAVRVYERKTISMHRVLLCLTDIKIQCDHRDTNGLNNQRSNLRKASSLQNCRNRKNKKNSSSKYKGVYVENRPKIINGTNHCWAASITHNGKQHILQRFPYTPEGEILAAKEYDKAAKLYHGEFANLNFKTE